MTGEIRTASARDLRAIAAIYNDAVRGSTATMDTTPKSAAQMRAWLKEHRGRYPAVVAVDADGEVVGWAALSRWSDRRAYADTAEISVYVRKDARGRGVGTALARRVLAEGRRKRLHTVVARIAGENAVSVCLHRRLGFSPVGVLKGVGFKFGRRIDVLMMQKVLAPPRGQA